METLGAKIKHLRNKLTQEELAAILQVDRSTLASWEVNRREPDIATLCRIANFFKVSIDWLVGYSQDISSHSRYIHETVNDYGIKIDEAWQTVMILAQHYGLKPDDVRQLIEINSKIARSLNGK
ncbi:transcriptional regulator with XRE-family HTH domain [Sporomusaceae bacterium BoRhaA]|uniref:helix-turn-helix domain-containing protein n=1 Tax=Pelorhabdus rhamnosifermentans TaxID=2772457 RepID=UPI001C0645A5|nr:helix-turn-helix transcriptional regulator [Pelorhabdus rhamnosifermentans]MBU2700620.1 transcriptional regulator with XRE-family HTH domain [Pelorhabdus rhamnosifermentans]